MRPSSFTGPIPIGRAMFGPFAFQWPSIGIQQTATATEIRVTRKGRIDFEIDGVGDTDCDGDGRLYEFDTVNDAMSNEFDFHEIVSYVLTDPGSIPATVGPVDGVATGCADRGVSSTRIPAGQTSLCFTLRGADGDDDVLCAVKSWAGSWLIDDLSSAANEDHPSHDESKLPPGGPKRVVAVHRNGSSIGLRWPDAAVPPVDFVFGTGDMPYIVRQNLLDAMHLVWHDDNPTPAGNDVLVHQVCASASTTDCDAAGEWQSVGTIVSGVGGNFQNAAIAYDGLFQVAAYEGAVGADRQVFLKARCAPPAFPAVTGSWPAVPGPVAVQALVAGTLAQSFTRNARQRTVTGHQALSASIHVNLRCPPSGSRPRLSLGCLSPFAGSGSPGGAAPAPPSPTR